MKELNKKIGKLCQQVFKIKLIDRNLGYTECKNCGKKMLYSNKTKSFICPNCKISGNIVEITKEIMAQQNNHLSYNQVLFKIVKKHLPKETKNVAELLKSEAEKKEKMFKLNEEAYTFFREELSKKTEALKYLEARGFTKEDFDEYSIGYAPSYNALLKKLKNVYTEKELEEVGLIKLNETTNKYGDVFRDRIIFTIKDEFGHIVGFSGRIYGDNTKNPKYLNTKGTDIFIKNQILYNLHNIKMGEYKNIFVAEGFMDVIALKKAGIHNAVCAMGTAFTINHYKILNKYTKNIILLFDGDEAGIKASERTINKLFKYTQNIKICILCDNLDPDEFIKEKGLNAFKKYVNEHLYKWEELYVDNYLKKH